jgi:small subunit ribosomal protein S5e
MAASAEIDAEIQQQLTNEVKLFNRWSFDDVSVYSSPIPSLRISL